MSGASLSVKAVGPAAAALSPGDLQTLVDAALVQLFGVVGGAVPYSFEPTTGNAEGFVTLDKRDEPKLRQALLLVSSHNGKPLRIDLQ